MFLIDTNVLSELRLIGLARGDSNVTRWQASINLDLCRYSVLTLKEIEIGVLRAERRDVPKGRALRRWFEEQVRPRMQDRLISIDAAVARRAATLHVPDPRPEMDALIAATALVHGMTLVTRNVKDMAPTGVPILNPWEFGTVQEPRADDGR